MTLIAPLAWHDYLIDGFTISLLESTIARPAMTLNRDLLDYCTSLYRNKYRSLIFLRERFLKKWIWSISPCLYYTICARFINLHICARKKNLLALGEKMQSRCNLRYGAGGAKKKREKKKIRNAGDGGEPAGHSVRRTRHGDIRLRSRGNKRNMFCEGENVEHQDRGGRTGSGARAPRSRTKIAQ